MEANQAAVEPAVDDTAAPLSPRARARARARETEHAANVAAHAAKTAALAVERREQRAADHLALAATLAAEAAERLRERLPEMADRDLVATYDKASDKHLDYRDGRRGTVQIDQSQHLALPPGTTIDDLRALRDALAPPQLRGA